MSRTTKSSATDHAVPEPDAKPIPGRPVALAPFSLDLPVPAMEPEPDPGEREDALADDGPSRLSELLERAGEPVATSAVSAPGGGRRSAHRWRNDPHVLGRMAAVVVVLVLAVACAAVAMRVLG